jgi:pilus assembly protein Flp/PilA
MQQFYMEIPMPLTFLVSKVMRHARVRGAVIFRLIRDDRGVTAIEYTLIAALIAMAFVALITQIGDFVSTPFETIASKL